MTRLGSKRDTTLALEIVKRLLGVVRHISDVELADLAQLLGGSDARTGKRDPHLRKGFHAKKSDPKRSPAKKKVAKAKKAARRTVK